MSFNYFKFDQNYTLFDTKYSTTPATIQGRCKFKASSNLVNSNAIRGFPIIFVLYQFERVYRKLASIENNVQVTLMDK